MTQHQSSPKYVEVYAAYGQLAGEMVRLLLVSMEIPAIASQESAGITYGLTVGPIGEVKIMVPEDRADEALEIIRQMEEGELTNTLYPDQLPPEPADKDNKMDQEENLKEDESDGL